MTNYIIGISCFYHDSAAVLLKDGEIIVAIQEERFTRKKYDSSFPINSIKYCLEYESINLKDIEAIVYYEKPLLTFERLLETYISTSPRGLRSFIASMQVWLKQKLFLKSEIKKEFKNIQKKLLPEEKPFLPQLLFTEHHQSHAAAAFYPSPFEEAVILCLDAVGEWATTSTWVGKNNKIKNLWEINFPHSLGLLYSSFTYYCGFKVNSGEYKLMGLAPYGKPIYANKIKNKLIDIKSDGTFRLDMKYFKFHRGFKMTSEKFHKLFGQPPRNSKEEITQFHMDIASSIQLVTEEIIIKLVKALRRETKIKNLCMAGGVALNCVANGKLIKQNIFENVWIQPASGDAGSSVGSALIAWYEYFNNTRKVNSSDSMKGTFLGCGFSNKEIISYLENINAPYKSMNDQELFDKIANLLDEGKIIGWFNGRMEFGPRALGARSIIGDPRKKDMQSKMNLKIKFRESFRPFAPSILEEEVFSQFELEEKSPYMLLVAPVKKEICKKLNKKDQKLKGLKKLDVVRSSIPAVTHVNYSARVQTVSKKTNPRYYKLIKAFKSKTGCPSIINTSFNVRGEPIVRNPQDAYRCFMRTNIDILVLENQILYKGEQPTIEKDEKWMQEFEMD